MQEHEPTPLLIVGATGRVGRLLLSAFEREQNIRAIPQTRHLAPPGWLHWQPGMALPEQRERTVMLHLAGPTPSGSGADYQAHVTLALAGLKAARQARVAHVLLASSAAVYGRPPDEMPLTEDAPCDPQTEYGRAKLEMETAARDFCANGGMSLTLLRIGNVAGADLLMRNALAARENAPLRLDRFSDGRSPRRAYIGAETLAEVLSSLVRLVRQEAPLPEVLNIAAPGEGVEMAGLLDALAAAGFPVPTIKATAPDGALPALPLCTRRLEALHKFSPEESTAAAMVAQWMRLRQRA